MAKTIRMSIPEVKAFLIGRATYEKGKFLAGSVAALPKETKDAIEAHLVRVEHPLAKQPGTQQDRIVEWVKDGSLAD
jgi:hypothetical protein